MPGVCVSEIASLVGAKLIGDGSVLVTTVSPLANASPGALGFVRSSSHVSDFLVGHCSAVLLASGIDAQAVGEQDPLKRPLLIVADADLALIKVLDRLAPPGPDYAPGVHALACVHPAANIDPSAHVGPFVTIGAHAHVHAKAIILDGCTVGFGVTIGEGTFMHPGARVLDRCTVGRKCILHSGVVIGGDGFGYHPSPDGSSLVKVPHIGNVEVHDHVEIGDNSCVDRAKFGSTIIGAGTKLDNLVQIGHGCVIGRCCVMCGQSGLSGSVTLADGVQIGGKSGVTNHVKIGAGARIGASAGVVNDVPPGGVYMGEPAIPATEWKRNHAAIRSLIKIIPQIKRYFRSVESDL